jgi:hypothetical protein
MAANAQSIWMVQSPQVFSGASQLFLQPTVKNERQQWGKTYNGSAA